jgi:hypothetical protein
MSLPSTEKSEAEGVAHIMGLLDLGDDGEIAVSPTSRQNSDSNASGGADESDEAPDENPVSQDDADQNDPDEVPVIVPPKSWKADKHALFEALPDEAKQYIAELADMDSRAVSRQITQTVEQRKAYEAEVARQNQAIAQQVQHVQALMLQTYPEIQQYQNVDWDKLAQTDQNAYIRESHNANRAIARFQTAQQTLQQLNQYQSAQQQQALTARGAEEAERVKSILPEYADPEKAQSYVQSIISTMQDSGLGQNEIIGILGQMNDARVFGMLHEYAQLKSEKKARMSAQTKKGTQPAPRSIAPTAAPTRDRSKNAKQAERLNALVRSNQSFDKKDRLSRQQQESLAVSLITDLL